MQKNTQKWLLGILSANGIITASTDGVQVKDFKNLVVQLETTGSATLTAKFQQSNQCEYSGPTGANQPTVDFSSAASYTNPWDFVEVYDNANSATRIPGSTGVAVTGTDIVKYYVVNSNTVQQFCVQISGYSAGTVRAWLLMTNNA
jgi:hypothetical protein